MFGGGRQQLLAGLRQGLVAQAGAVLQPEVEARGRAQLRQGGAFSASTMAFLWSAKALLTRATTASTCMSAPWRSFQSFSVTKNMAEFGPLPYSLKPLTEYTNRTGSCFIM